MEYVDPSVLTVFSGSGLNMAYFFSGVGEEGKEMLVTQLVTPLLKAYYQHFAFVVVGRSVSVHCGGLEVPWGLYTA